MVATAPRTTTAAEEEDASTPQMIRSVLSIYEANIAKNAHTSASLDFLVNVASTDTTRKQMASRRASWCSGSRIATRTPTTTIYSRQQSDDGGDHDEATTLTATTTHAAQHRPLVKYASTCSTSDTISTTNSSSYSTESSSSNTIDEQQQQHLQQYQNQNADIFVLGTVNKTKALFENMAAMGPDTKPQRARLSRRSSMGPGIMMACAKTKTTRDNNYAKLSRSSCLDDHHEDNNGDDAGDGADADEPRMSHDEFQKMRDFWCQASAKAAAATSEGSATKLDRYPPRWNNSLPIQPRTVRGIALTAAVEAAGLVAPPPSSIEAAAAVSAPSAPSAPSDSSSSRPTSKATTPTATASTSSLDTSFAASSNTHTSAPLKAAPRPGYLRSDSVESFSSCRSLCVYDGANLYLTLPQGCMVFKPNEDVGGNNSNSSLLSTDCIPQRPSRHGSMCSQGSSTMLSRRRSSLGASTFLSRASSTSTFLTRASSVSSISTVAPPRRVRFSDYDEVFVFEIDDIGSVFSEDGLELAQDFEQVLWETGACTHDSGPRQVRRQSSTSSFGSQNSNCSNWQYVGFVEEVSLPQDFTGFTERSGAADSLPRPRPRRGSLEHVPSNSLLDNVDKTPHFVPRTSSMVDEGDEEDALFEDEHDVDFVSASTNPKMRDASPRRAVRRRSVEHQSPTTGDVSPRRAMRRGSIQTPHHSGEDVSPRRAMRRVSIETGSDEDIKNKQNLPIPPYVLEQDPDATTVSTTGTDSRAHVQRQATDSTSSTTDSKRQAANIDTPAISPSPEEEMIPKHSNNKTSNVMSKKRSPSKAHRRASMSDLVPMSILNIPTTNVASNAKEAKSTTSNTKTTTKSPSSPRGKGKSGSTKHARVNRRASTGGSMRPTRLRGSSFDDDTDDAQAMAEICASLKAESNSIQKKKQSRQEVGIQNKEPTGVAEAGVPYTEFHYFPVPVPKNTAGPDNRKFLSNASRYRSMRHSASNITGNKLVQQHHPSSENPRPDYVRGYSFLNRNNDCDSESEEEDSIFLDFCDDTSVLSLVSAASSLHSMGPSTMRGNSFVGTVRNRA